MRDHERDDLPGGWRVFSSTVIEDGILRQDPRVNPSPMVYAPAEYPKIATEFAQLHAGDEEAVLAFGRRWGRLGYTELQRHGVVDPIQGRDPAAGELLREAFDLGPWPQPHFAPLLEISPGDPLPWIWGHARGVKACLDLIPYLTPAGTSGNRGRPQRSPQGQGAPQGPLPEGLRVLGSVLGAGVVVEPSPDDLPPPMRQLVLHFGSGLHVVTYTFATLGLHQDLVQGDTARRIVTTIINLNLRNLRSQLAQVDEEGRLDVRPRFVALLDVVYWHVARFVSRAMRLARCEECGASFPVTDRRQRFCPPEGWVVDAAKSQGTRPDSRCAKRARMRRLRARERAQRMGQEE